MNEHKELKAREEILAALKSYKPQENLKHERDILSGRYRISTQQIARLSSSFATAFEATDTQAVAGAPAIYALVYHNHVPMRKKNIEALREFRHPHMVSLLDSGLVEISALSEVRFVVILEKPAGKTIAELLSGSRNAISATMVINYLLRPLVEILTGMNKLGISHNRINLGNVFISGNQIILGECVSEPAGFSQDPTFEPPEYVLTSPLAKPDYAISLDCYALAVLTLHMLLGFKPIANVNREVFARELLAKGSYHTLVIQWDFSNEMQDFFRGLLNDTRRERWNPESIEGWLAGRQFNLILPSLPTESARGFDFMGTPYYNRRSIAQAIFSEWSNAAAFLLDNKLGRWIENSVHKPELADLVSRAIGNINADNLRFERPNSDTLARIIVMLDPAGPMRFRHLSLMIDTIGTALTHAFLRQSHEDVQTIVHMLESDLPWFSAEQQTPLGADYAPVLWKLQKLRGFIRMKGMGFGIERCIYDVHPELPCQSPLVKRYHVTTLRELLLVLDELAPQKADTSEFMDRHIAGFIGSRLDLTKEINANELEPVYSLTSHPGLIGLKLLVRAQNKVSGLPLYGVCNWVALQLLPISEMIHKRATREDFSTKLMNAAISGSLKNIANLTLNPSIFVNDYVEYQNAVKQFAARRKHITELKNNTMLKRHSRMVGRGIAQTISYGICLFVAYYTLKYHFHF